MPAEDFAPDREVDLATIPLHVKFQRLLDLFGAATSESLAEIMSQFEERLVRKDRLKQPTADECEFLDLINLAPDQLAATRRAFMKSVNRAALHKLTDTALKPGPTSPPRGFGSS